MGNILIESKGRKCYWHQILIVASLLWLISCSPGGKSKQQTALVVAVAANVQFAMEEIKIAFEKQVDHPVHLIIGSSGKLTAQIQQGAPYDVFISANMIYPETLYQDSLTTAPAKIYAFGTLVWWTLDSTSIPSPLATDLPASVRKIAIANPRNAPYGEEAVRALTKLGLWESTEPKTVYGENIAQTNQYILSGAVDLGITAKSIVVSPQWAQTGSWQEIPKDLYQPIQQGIVLTRSGKKRQPQIGELFYKFMTEATAQQILRSYGYQVPGNEVLVY